VSGFRIVLFCEASGRILGTQSFVDSSTSHSPAAAVARLSASRIFTSDVRGLLLREAEEILAVHQWSRSNRSTRSKSSSRAKVGGQAPQY
jgi:hypothetical protein